MAGCGPHNLKWFTMIPGIRKSRKIGIDLDDHFRNPHLETKLPVRMLYGRDEFNEFHFLSNYMVRLPQAVENRKNKRILYLNSSATASTSWRVSGSKERPMR